MDRSTGQRRTAGGALGRLAVGAMLLGVSPAAWPQAKRAPELGPVQILPPQPPEPTVVAGPEPDVEILFSSDVLGYYQPCG